MAIELNTKSTTQINISALKSNAMNTHNSATSLFQASPTSGKKPKLFMYSAQQEDRAFPRSTGNFCECRCFCSDSNGLQARLFHAASRNMTP